MLFTWSTAADVISKEWAKQLVLRTVYQSISAQLGIFPDVCQRSRTISLTKSTTLMIWFCVLSIAYLQTSALTPPVFIQSVFAWNQFGLRDCKPNGRWD